MKCNEADCINHQRLFELKDSQKMNILLNAPVSVLFDLCEKTEKLLIFFLEPQNTWRRSLEVTITVE